MGASLLFFFFSSNRSSTSAGRGGGCITPRLLVGGLLLWWLLWAGCFSSCAPAGSVQRGAPASAAAVAARSFTAPRTLSARALCPCMRAARRDSAAPLERAAPRDAAACRRRQPNNKNAVLRSVYAWLRCKAGTVKKKQNYKNMARIRGHPPSVWRAYACPRVLKQHPHHPPASVVSPPPVAVMLLFISIRASMQRPCCSILISLAARSVGAHSSSFETAARTRRQARETGRRSWAEGEMCGGRGESVHSEKFPKLLS